MDHTLISWAWFGLQVYDSVSHDPVGLPANHDSICSNRIGVCLPVGMPMGANRFLKWEKRTTKKKLSLGFALQEDIIKKKMRKRTVGRRNPNIKG